MAPATIMYFPVVLFIPKSIKQVIEEWKLLITFFSFLWSMIVPYIQKTLSQIPAEIRTFFVRAIVIFIAWLLLYNLVLFPTRTPDRQLTEITAKSTGFLYNLFINSDTKVAFKENRTGDLISTTIYLDNKAVISIADACNALGLYVLYVSILFCFKAPLKRKIIFSLAGCAAIFIMNGLRCFMLAWLYMKQSQFFSFAHHYLFQISVYLVIFFMWTLYIKRLKKTPAIKA